MSNKNRFTVCLLLAASRFSPRAFQARCSAGALICAFFFGAVGNTAIAQTFPDRPVRFIVPFPPGGGTDGFGRILGAKLAEGWGQQVIIDNRGGAQGNIGTALGAKAVGDGYTLTLAHQGALV